MCLRYDGYKFERKFSAINGNCFISLIFGGRIFQQIKKHRPILTNKVKILFRWLKLISSSLRRQTGPILIVKMSIPAGVSRPQIGRYSRSEGAGYIKGRNMRLDLIISIIFLLCSLCTACEFIKKLYLRIFYVLGQQSSLIDQGIKKYPPRLFCRYTRTESSRMELNWNG